MLTQSRVVGKPLVLGTSQVCYFRQVIICSGKAPKDWFLTKIRFQDIQTSSRTFAKWSTGKHLVSQ